MQTMKILVTGAAGFIGYHLVKRLAGAGHDIVGVDNMNDYYDVSLKYGRLRELGIFESEIEGSRPVRSSPYPNLTFGKLDITDMADLQALFAGEKFDIVINLAAQAGVRHSIEAPSAYIQSNIVGFFNILECCRHNGIKHLVYASSSSVYGNNDKIPFSEGDRVDCPVSLYAATKRSNELMAHAYSHLYGLPTTGLRFFTVYGPWGRPDMSPMLFAEAIAADRAIKVFNYGDMERDFTYIDDIIDGMEAVIPQIPGESDPRPYYRLFNIGNSEPVRLTDFISVMEDALGMDAVKEMLPMQPGDVKRTCADTSELHRATGYRPSTPLRKGMKEFVGWFKDYYKKGGD